MKQATKIIVISVINVLMFANIMFAGSWVKENTAWKYLDDNGEFAISNWKFLNVDGNYANYYFDENGYMAVGLRKIDGHVYSFNQDGTANSNNSVFINGQKYFTKNKGIVVDLPIDFNIDPLVTFAITNSDNRNAFDAMVGSVIEEQKIKEEAKKAESISAREREQLAFEAKIKIEAENKSIMENYTLKMINSYNDSVTGIQDNGMKFYVDYPVPVLEGIGADAVNAVMKDKLQSTMYRFFFDYFNDRNNVINVERYVASKVMVEHRIDKNMLVLSFVGKLDGQDNMFLAYMDLNTLEMWMSK